MIPRIIICEEYQRVTSHYLVPYGNENADFFNQCLQTEVQKNRTPAGDFERIVSILDLVQQW